MGKSGNFELPKRTSARASAYPSSLYVWLSASIVFFFKGGEFHFAWWLAVVYLAQELRNSGIPTQDSVRVARRY